MERYSEYKDSGVQWLGEIPKHWEIKKAKYIWQELFSLSEKGNEGLLSVSQNDGITKARNDSRSESLIGYKKVSKDNLVINIMLAWMGGLGVSAYDGIVSPAYCVYKLTDDYNPKFMHYLYKTPQYLAEFARRSTGVIPSRWRMYTDDFGQVLTIIPPLPEQQSIAAYLDAITGKIDKAIAQQQEMIDLLNERKQIIINQAVTKGLNPDVSMKDSGMEWIGQIPEHWEICKLKYLFRRIADGTHFSPSTVEEGYPYITASDVRGIGIDYANAKKISSEDYKKLVATGCRASNGDILLVKDGATTGRVGLKIDDVECVTLSSVAMLTPKETQNTHYLMYMMMSDAMQKQILLSMAGAAMPRITLIKLNNFLAVKPPIDEQIKIVKYVKSKIDPLNRSIRLSEQQIVLLQERKQIIINEVVTGKVRVS